MKVAILSHRDTDTEQKTHFGLSMMVQWEQIRYRVEEVIFK